MMDPFVDGIGRSGRRRVPGRREWVRGRHLLSVPSMRIDELLVGRRCSLLRVDAAGYELTVLQGAEELLRRPHAPALLVAVDEAALGRFRPHAAPACRLARRARVRGLLL